MAPVNTRTAAVIDPILSTHARGYRNMEFVSHLLFPRVQVSNRSMRVIRFGKEAFRMVATRRAPGSQVKTVQYGYASDPISLFQESLAATVPVEHLEEATSVPNVDLASGALNVILEIIDLNLEFETSLLARNAANYDANHKLTLAGASRWTNAASTPQADIKAANEAVRRSIGRYGNTLLLGATAYNALTTHPTIKDQFKYTSKDSITAEMLAAYFGLARVIVGKAVYLPETAPDNALASDVWGDDAILAYVPQSGENFQVPAFGYTYELAGYPVVEGGRYDADIKSWKYDTTAERRPYLVGAEGGFLFTDAGKP